MSQIEELQSRITAALDRIGQGLEAQSANAGADPSELDALRSQLDDEKAVSAQMEERNKRIKEKLDTAEAAVATIEASAEAKLQKLDQELQALRRANQQLRDNNLSLRNAIEAGVAEPHLINKAMMAELQALRAARNADKAETDAVLDELARLLQSDERETA